MSTPHTIPASLRIPGHYISIEAQGFDSAEGSLKQTLLLGALTSSASPAPTARTSKAQNAPQGSGQSSSQRIAPLTPTRISSLVDAKTKLAPDCELYTMVEAFLAINPSLELKVMGTADPQSTLSHLQGIEFDYLVCGEGDVAFLQGIGQELDRRFQPDYEGGGARGFAALIDTSAAALVAKATKLNSAHLSIIGWLSPSLSIAQLAAQNAALCIGSLMADPSASLQGLTFKGVEAKEFNFQDRNLLLHSGISTYLVRPYGVLIERQITTYTQNAEGDASASYLDIQVPEVLDAIRSLQIHATKQAFEGYKLAEDAMAAGPFQKVLTPKLYQAFLLNLYAKVMMTQKGWVQDYEHYKSTLVVQIDPGDKNRLLFKDEPMLSGRLQIVSGQMRFH